ncbi:hypothetical protein CDEST_08160 [Colletotrichum destructivum]|uniref:Uncharacterized protein n=1 Tax=Colletotrichum destructivum TaxID=34406 RepID=A0AAX4IJ75_9PEZI|nr:hypothetical protein CDEST_08160 [Colletotrichum destructivum]
MSTHAKERITSDDHYPTTQCHHQSRPRNRTEPLRQDKPFSRTNPAQSWVSKGCIASHRLFNIAILVGRLFPAELGDLDHT